MKAKYLLKTVGKMSKDGVAALGVGATYFTPGMMPREWAEWSFNRLDGERDFDLHEKAIAPASAAIEFCEGLLFTVGGLVTGFNTDLGEWSSGVAGLGVYMVIEGGFRLEESKKDRYVSNLPVSIVSNAVQEIGKEAKRFGNYVSDSYHKVAEEEKDAERDAHLDAYNGEKANVKRIRSHEK
jgi:hypothetical protein